MAQDRQTYCGSIAIIGRPNVGKSTFLNACLGRKVSITSRKAQTTRRQIMGVVTQALHQIVYIDTPGLHRKAPRVLNRAMNKAVLSALTGIDVLLIMLEALRWTEDDEGVIAHAKQFAGPVVVLVNKIDRLADKAQLLPYLQRVQAAVDCEHLFPISARSGEQVDQVQSTLNEYLPAGPFHFPRGQITDCSDAFMVAELIREQIFHFLHQEVPYSIRVQVESLDQGDKLWRIHALIWVETPGQKTIVLGRKGEQLKQIGTRARLQIERLYGHKVFLKLWVKIQKGWADDARYILNA